MRAHLLIALPLLESVAAAVAVHIERQLAARKMLLYIVADDGFLILDAGIIAVSLHVHRNAAVPGHAIALHIVSYLHNMPSFLLPVQEQCKGESALHQGKRHFLPWEFLPAIYYGAKAPSYTPSDFPAPNGIPPPGKACRDTAGTAVRADRCPSHRLPSIRKRFCADGQIQCAIRRTSR